MKLIIYTCYDQQLKSLKPCLKFPHTAIPMPFLLQQIFTMLKEYSEKNIVIKE
jgi:hypothetical protein